MTTAESRASLAAPAVRTPFAAGWLMVVVAAAAMVATFPGRTHGLGTVTERLLADPNLPLSFSESAQAAPVGSEDWVTTRRATYGTINLWATLIGAAFCLGIGRLIDRFGARLALAAVLALLGGAVVGMSLAGSATAFFLGVTLTRGFGQSALSVVSLTLVGKWFRRRLGLAMGVYSVLVSAGFLSAFKAAEKAAELDWRVMWGGIGWGLIALAPVAWVVTRSTPESCGLEPDGGGPAVAEVEADAPVFTLAAALRTPAFWVFALATSVLGLISSGVSLFNQSILADLGFDKKVYYQAMQIGIPCGLFANFVAGWLAGRIPLGKLTAAALLLLSACLVGLTQLRTYPHVVLYAVTNAAAGGVITVVFFTVWGKLYGRKELGRIQGAAQMLTVFASAAGPAALASAKHASGSYAPALFALSAAAAVLAVAAWLVPLPSRQRFEAGPP
jgi:MFS family permease